MTNNRDITASKKILFSMGMAGLIILSCLAQGGAETRNPSQNASALMVAVLNTNFFAEALQDQGLDVRDSQNRPVKSARASSGMRGLFVATVFRLLSSEGLPALSRVRRFLENVLDPLAERLSAASRRIKQAAECFVFFQIRRLADWFALFAAVLLVSLLPLQSSPQYAKSSSKSSNHSSQNSPLRC